MRRVDNTNLPTSREILDSIITPNVKNLHKLKVKESRDCWDEFLVNLNKQYYEKAESGKLYMLEILKDELPNNADSECFEELYNFLRRECFGLFPNAYDNLKNPICPFCEGLLSTKVTLEHVIPKGKYGVPELAILPVNLIKCCGECNTSKHQKRAEHENNSEINLYFECYDITSLIDFEFVYEIDCSIFFPIIKIKDFETLHCMNDEVKYNRIKNFISVYNLEETYNLIVSNEFRKILNNLSKYKGEQVDNNTLRNFINLLKEKYEQYVSVEKDGSVLLLNNNFFGMKLCEKLSEEMRCETSIARLKNEIKKISQENSSVALSKFKNFGDLISKLNTFSGKGIYEFLDHIDYFIRDNYSDFTIYATHLRSDDRVHKFGLNNKINKFQIKLVEEIFMYYIMNQKDFGDFKENCISIIR